MMHAATVQGVNALMSVGSAVIGRAGEEIIEKKLQLFNFLVLLKKEDKIC